MIKINNIKGKIGFLIGLSLCNNIFYVISQNNFYLNISNIITIIGMFYILIFEKKNINDYFKSIDRSCILYFCVSIFSIVFATISLKANVDLLMSYFNGIPSLILLFVNYFVMMGFADKKNDILKGIVYGFIINLFVSVIQYYYFTNGKLFTFFYHLFPTDSFQICGDYYKLNSDPSITTTLKVYFFRASGLFIETSYFTTFVVGSFLIAMNYIKNNVLKFVSLFTAVMLCVISESGNIIILFGIIGLYLLLCVLKNNFKMIISKKKSFIIPFVFLLILVAGISLSNNQTFLDKVNKTINSSNISDADNESRFRTIKEGIELIYKYPLGIGYNMTPKVLKMHFPYERHSYIFSTLLVNLLELGFIGNIVYMVFALKFIIKILKYSNKKEEQILALSLLGLFLCQLSNGINYWNIQFILGMYAINNMVYNDLKNRKSII